VLFFKFKNYGFMFFINNIKENLFFPGKIICRLFLFLLFALSFSDLVSLSNFDVSNQSFLFKTKHAQKHAITYEGGDRFGDRVLVYAQARYLKYLTSVSFLYRPFIYTDQVSIEYDAKPYDECYKSYNNTYYINSNESLSDFFRIIRDPSSVPTLFILEYFPSDISEWDTIGGFKVLFNHPWDDEDFRDYLNKCLVPLSKIQDFSKKEVLNVAVHVRTLSGADTHDTSIRNLPLKHPSIEYHQKQIRKVYKWNSENPMQVFIFTDSKNQKEILKQVKQGFNESNIEFRVQEFENMDTNYAVQDFFGMQKFDVLIATQSNFSMMAAKLGKFDMVIFPIHVNGRYPSYTIDRVQIISRGSDWFPYKMNFVCLD